MAMRVVFVYESNHPIEVVDGLTTSLEALRSTFDIVKVNIANQSIKIEDDDFILAWGAFGSAADEFARRFVNRKGICIGGVTEPENMFEYDVLFYETKWYREKIKFHPNIVHAFGIDTNVYYDMAIDRDIDYLGVGAFALWKRWEKFLDKKGNRRVIGEIQKDNLEESEGIINILEKGGVVCKNMMPAHDLMLEYNRAKTVYIPATIYGGGERAILEARACGCNIIIEEDNPKLKELLTCKIFDCDYYVKQLKRGINERDTFKWF